MLLGITFGTLALLSCKQEGGGCHRMHALNASPDCNNMYVLMYRMECAVLELCLRYE